MPSARSPRRSTASVASTRSSSMPGSAATASLLDLEPGHVRGASSASNVTGAFLMARAAISHLLERRGAIVTHRRRSPACGQRPSSLAYCTSKAALAMLTQCIARRSRPGRRACELPLPRLGADADGRRRDGLAGRAELLVARGCLRGRDGGRAAAAAEHARGDRRDDRLAPLGRRVVRERRRDPRRRRRHDGRRRRARLRGGADERPASPSPASRSRRTTSSAASASRATSTFTDLSPIDEQPLGEIARGGQREADLAVAAATAAFPAWAALGAAGRAELPPPARRPDRRERRAARRRSSASTWRCCCAR